MPDTPLPRAFIRLLCGLAGTLTLSAHALDAPPIKPGLWQIHSERSVDGKPAPQMGAQMSNLTPEMKQRVEAMMKQRGVDMSAGGGDIKVCLSKESLDSGQWQGRQAADGRCKTDYGSRSSKSWKWRSVCSEPSSEVDGEAVFESPERYTVKVVMSMATQGKTRVSNMTNTSTWLGADCGDLKPVSPKTMGAPGTR